MFPLAHEAKERRFPGATLALLAINTGVLAYALTLSSLDIDAFVQRYGFVPREFLRSLADSHGTGRSVWLTPFTSLFLHAGIAHLIGNLLFLGFFGPVLESAVGWGRFVAAYIVCGLAGSALHLLQAPDAFVATLGASGAVSGVLGAYVVCFGRPGLRSWLSFELFSFRVRVPAPILLGVWLGGQFLGFALGGAAGGVAWWAHLGGFLTGAGLGLLRRKNRGVSEVPP